MSNSTFKLGKQQEEAFELIKKFIKSNKNVFSLTGSAGSGKTTIMKCIVDYIENFTNKDFCLCAPTNKAKMILSTATNMEAVTLHKLLALSPNLDIFNLDFKFLKFKSGISENIPIMGIVLVDEASMINDELYDLLLEKCKDFKTKIIFISDSKQLMPVNNFTVSKVYQIEDCYNLTEIFRQEKESALVPILLELREHSIERFDESISDKGSIYTYDELKRFVEKAVDYFRISIKNKDILDNKITAYTNDQVNNYNKAIKRMLFDSDDEYFKLGFLTCKDSFKTSSSFEFWNSMDYIITTKPQKINIMIPQVMSVPGYKFKLYDSSTKKSSEISILSNEIGKGYKDYIASKIELIRLEALNYKKKKNFNMANKCWREYFMIMASFTTPDDLYYEGRLIRKATFRDGYASTVHSLQGSSLNNIFIDIKNLNTNKNELEKTQLQYVALSRTRNNAYILQ